MAEGSRPRCSIKPARKNRRGEYLGFTYLMPVLKEHRAAVYMVKSDSQVANLGGQTAFTALGKGIFMACATLFRWNPTAIFAFHNIGF